LNPPQKKPKSAARHETVDARGAGQRLDNFLLGALKGVPRSHIYRLIRSGQVRVNSARVTPRHRLEIGDRVRVPPVAERATVQVAREPADLEWLEERILFEDARLIVIDKPAGLAAHGGSGVALGCIEALRALRRNARDLELVHRLDRATSGCLLVAKRRSALRMLHALLRDGAVDKRYWCLVKGRWRRASLAIEAPLLKRRGEREARVKVDPRGKAARTVFRLLGRARDLASLLEIELATGRTHQIRVHAAHLGHPLAGDDRYGDRDFNERLAGYGLRRMFLHALSVQFTWPDTGEPFSVNAPLPLELANVLAALELAAPGPARGARTPPS
jgi:23S rRNA pseudouridine955/2504/2580 synthase